MALPAPAHDSTCLVTGASSGIGVEIARQLAARGLGVTLVARRADRLRTLADSLTSSFGVRVEVIAADLAEPDSRSAVADTLDSRGLRVEVLVNNAGVGTFGPVASASRQAEVAIVRIDVEAVVDLCTRFVPGMVSRRSGAILNVASLIAFQPVPFQATYGASKAFVLSFSDALHEELRGTGVTVTAVCPGPVHTEFGESGGFGGADQRIPSFLWLGAERVAKDALDGLENGERVVVPGPLNQVAALYGQHLPRSLLLPLVRRIWPVS